MLNETTVDQMTKVIDAIEKYYEGDYHHTFLGIESVEEFGVTANIEVRHCGCCSAEIEREFFSWNDLAEYVS